MRPNWGSAFPGFSGMWATDLFEMLQPQVESNGFDWVGAKDHREIAVAAKREEVERGRRRPREIW